MEYPNRTYGGCGKGIGTEHTKMNEYGNGRKRALSNVIRRFYLCLQWSVPGWPIALNLIKEQKKIMDH